jgi:hypothetical protein
MPRSDFTLSQMPMDRLAGRRTVQPSKEVRPPDYLLRTTPDHSGRRGTTGQKVQNLFWIH